MVRSFSYDSTGNRAGSGYVYAPGNRLLATPTDTLTYDASGNVTWWSVKATGDYKTFTWDPEDRLTEVTLHANEAQTPYRTVTFAYDGVGRRVKKVVSGDQSKTVRYVLDGSELLAELDEQGSWTRRYTPHPTRVDRMLALRDSSGATYFLHRDHVGNVVTITDSAGAVVTAYRYDGFGRHTAIAQSYQSPLLWQAREHDHEIGLYYFRARYYSQEVGRFLSEDPLRTPAVNNLYLFTGNDPVNFRDPFGLTCDDIDDEDEQEACKKEEELRWLVEMALKTGNPWFLEIIFSKFAEFVVFGIYSTPDAFCIFDSVRELGCGRWDYGKHTGNGALGNYVFGYVGRGIGIPTWVLENYGGAVEWYSDFVRIARGREGQGSGFPVFVRPFGDGADDNAQIRRGAEDRGRRD